MTITSHPPVAAAPRPTTRDLLRRGVAAGAAAALATTAVAALASAMEVSLEVDGEAIPLPAFAWWTVIGAALGVLLARLLRDRRRFLVTTIVATGMSIVPSVALPDDTSTIVVLVGAHLLAAAIVVPALARPLPSGAAGR